MPASGHACCAPARALPDAGPEVVAAMATAQRPHANGTDTPDLVTLSGGSFLMGCEDPGAYAEDGEGPVRETRVSAFQLDRHTVTNERFARFVAETGRRTDAETAGSAFVFAGF